MVEIKKATEAQIEELVNSMPLEEDDFLGDIKPVDLDDLFGNKSDFISKELKAEITEHKVPFEILKVAEVTMLRDKVQQVWSVRIQIQVEHQNAKGVTEKMPADGFCTMTFDKGIESRDLGFERLKEHLPYKYAMLESKPTKKGNTFYILKTFK